MFRLLDLFSGIGGFSLGLERTQGFKTVAFCEIDPFCRKVLKKHWPDVPAYEDVRDLTGERLRADGIAVDVICGGFPCQDISFAGKGAGIEGERSGLWSEYARIIGEVRPRYAIIENVSALLGRGLQRVLWDLAQIGFDAEWHAIPASNIGAPHRRDRLWIVAHTYSIRLSGDKEARGLACATTTPPKYEHTTTIGYQGSDAYADRQRQLQQGGFISQFWKWSSNDGWWLSEPDVGRVAHGVPSRVDRLRSLGNAVVPQIPELIGHAILAAEIDSV